MTSSSAESKKTEFTSEFLLTDEQILALGVDPVSVESYRRAHYQRAYSLSTWASQLGSRTFRSIEIPLTVADARAIRQKNYKRATDADEALLRDLHKRIQDVLTSSFPEGAFMKLDTRSPKDIPSDVLKPYKDDDESNKDDLEFAKYNKQFTSLLRQLIEAIPKVERTPNSLMAAFDKASAQFLRVQDADKALFLLTRSSRVRQDLSKLLEFPEKVFHSSIMLREWDDRVPDNEGGEFRGFVYGKKLNAVSQYASYLHFPEIVEQKDAIAKRIRDFFDDVVESIPHENYIIDFIVFKDGDIKVIELNPFYVGAGAGLFTWRENREQFMHGPFELRVLDHEPTEDDIESVLVPMWVRYIYSFRDNASSSTATTTDDSSWLCRIQ